MLLFDVDDFKSINDTYGHEIGDKALIKIVNTFKKVFRDDDCICRIGGDEFVVFLRHAGEIRHSLIEFKIDQISKYLGNTDDGLPPISISAGIVSGKNAANIEDLLKNRIKPCMNQKCAENMHLHSMMSDLLTVYPYACYILRFRRHGESRIIYDHIRLQASVFKPHDKMT